MNTLLQLQEAIRARLEADAYFAQTPATPVLATSVITIGERVNTTLQKLKTCATVTVVRFPYDPATRILQVRFSVNLFEKPVLNRAQDDAKNFLDLAITVFNRLSGWAPLGNWSPIVMSGGEPVITDEAKPLLNYQLDGFTELSL